MKIDFKNYSLDMLPPESDELITLHKDFEKGYVDHVIYPFLPGILVFLNDVHATYIPMTDMDVIDSALTINYCMSGRCEFKVSENIFRYMRDNYTSVGELTIRDMFYYPSDYYLGFEIYIFENLFTDETRSILGTLNIDIDILRRKYDNEEKLCIIDTGVSMQKLWIEMYRSSCPDKGLIRLNVLKILYELTHNTDISPANSSYLTRANALLAKQVRDILTEDISKHISMREVSELLGVSETSLKNYFSSMFGTSVSEYMRSLRLKQAAALLKDTDISISEISAMTGYSNQGRFARVFREYYGMLPLEYRHTLNMREE